MEDESRSTTRKVLIDVICLACVGFPVLFFYLFGSPYKRGFFCNDESIRYPFKESTVTSLMLYFVGLVLPICLFLIVEWIHFRSGEGLANKKVTFYGRKVHPWVWRCYCVIGVFGFGAASSQLLTDIAKYTIGRLRPHFWAVCQPSIDCSLEMYQNTYITDFSCKGNNARLIREGRLSFLSGHSSFSAYTMVFLVLYLQCRVYWKGSHLLRHVGQFICLSLAWFTALSRVSDYKHHWSDVLAGSLLGTTIAIVVVKFVSDLRLEDVRVYKPANTITDGPSNHGVNLTVTSKPGLYKQNIFSVVSMLVTITFILDCRYIWSKVPRCIVEEDSIHN